MHIFQAEVNAQQSTRQVSEVEYPPTATAATAAKAATHK
jgi:hypothetical protein